MVGWTLLADILGVVAFVGVMWAALRRRLVWLWKPGYLIPRIERHSGGGLSVTIISNNGGVGARYMTALSLTATPTSKPRNQTLDWISAVFIPSDSQQATFVFPEGASLQHARLRCARVNEDAPGTFHDASEQEEENIVRTIIAWGAVLDFKMETSEGTVMLHGHVHRHPMASERYSLARRLGRVI
jgi:hypothetical protein